MDESDKEIIFSCARDLGQCDGVIVYPNDINKHEQGIQALITLSRIGLKNMKQTKSKSTPLDNEIKLAIAEKMDQVLKYIRMKNRMYRFNKNRHIISSILRMVSYIRNAPIAQTLVQLSNED